MNAPDIKPRTISAGDDVDWITQRLRCNGRGILNLLRERIKLDVDRANKVRKGLLEFDENSSDASRFVVNPTRSCRNGFVVFTVYGGGVSVERQVWGTGDECNFTVTPEWDDATATCRLTVDGEAVEPWQVSQRALTPLIL